MRFLAASRPAACTARRRGGRRIRRAQGASQPRRQRIQPARDGGSSRGERRPYRARVRSGCPGCISLGIDGSSFARAFRRSPDRPTAPYRHRNDDLGLRPVIQPLEGEFDRRPRPLPTDFNQARKSFPRRHAEEGERYVQVSRRHWPPFDLVERRSHSRCQLCAIGVPGPKGKEEPQGSRAVLNGANALCEGVRPLHGLHDSGRPASATAVAW